MLAAGVRRIGGGATAYDAGPARPRRLVVEGASSDFDTAGRRAAATDPVCVGGRRGGLVPADPDLLRPRPRRPDPFAAFDLPSGDSFEVFGPSVQDNQYFTTGPVVGFVVEDLPAAVAELERAGVELLGGRVDGQGMGWRHFRAPDGNVYELGSS